MRLLIFLNFCILFFMGGLCLASESYQINDCKNRPEVINLEKSVPESQLQRRLKLPKGITIEVQKPERDCSSDPEQSSSCPLSKKQILHFLKETYLIYYGGEFHQYFGAFGCTSYGTVYYKNKKHIDFEINQAGNSYLILYYKNPVEARYGVSDSWKEVEDEANAGY